MNSVPMVGKLRQSLLTTQVEDELERQILSGEVPSGSSLPSEAELVERFGVSKVVVREAVRALAARGLVEVRQGRRPTVIGLSAAIPGHFFRMAALADSDSLMELVEVRRMLELNSVRLAALRATADEIGRVREALDVMDKSVDDPEAFRAADATFHDRLAAASGNRFLGMLLEALREPLRAGRIESQRGHAKRGLGLSGTVELHRRIVEAIAARDPDSAVRAMERQLDEMVHDLAAAENQPDAGPGP